MAAEPRRPCSPRVRQEEQGIALAPGGGIDEPSLAVALLGPSDPGVIDTSVTKRLERYIGQVLPYELLNARVATEPQMVLPAIGAAQSAPHARACA